MQRKLGFMVMRAAAVLMILAGFASAQFAPVPTPAFPVPSPFPFSVGGASPSSIVAGNFNSGPILGLAVANRASNNVTLILSNGMGGFSMGGPYKVGTNPSSLALIGVDKNNMQELAVTNQGGGTVSVLLFDITNGKLTATLGPYTTGAGPSSIAAGTFLAGGSTDLAIANRDSGNVTLLKGDGTGKFTPYTNGPFPAGNGPSSIVVGDFNLDGNMDLAVTNELDSTVSILLGNGAGEFQKAATSPFAVGTNPDFVVTGDFNGDGNPDLAILNLTSNNVTVLLGNGVGGFSSAPGSPFSVGKAPVSMAVGDFNGDLIPDLAIANSVDGTVTVLLGDGTGSFKPGPGSPFALPLDPNSPAGNPSSVCVGDFNGDGTPDLAVAVANLGEVTVLLNGMQSAPVMVSNASYSGTGPVAPNSVVTIFGTNLSSLQQQAVTGPPPTCLNGIGVTLTDAAGIQSLLSLLYVAATQIDAIIPPTAAPGACSFRVSPTSACQPVPSTATQTGTSQKGSVTLAAVAPSLYSANGTGKGAAAGYVYNSVSGLPESYVFSCVPTPPSSTSTSSSPPPQTCTSSPISASQGITVLVLYGTGIRNRASLSNVTVAIAGQSLTPFYAGPATVNPEIDQVNVILPAALAGSGTVFATVSVSGGAASTAATSNAVAINIQ